MHNALNQTEGKVIDKGLSMINAMTDARKDWHWTVGR